MREVRVIGVLDKPWRDDFELGKEHALEAARGLRGGPALELRPSQEDELRSVDLQVRAIEALVAPAVAEALIVSELAIVFARPSLRSQVVGVLKRGDTVRVDAGHPEEDTSGASYPGGEKVAEVEGWGPAAAASGFLRIHAGAWIHQLATRRTQSQDAALTPPAKKPFESFFRSDAAYWVQFRLPGQGRPPQVAHVEAPARPIRLEVVSAHAWSQACRQVEMLPDGWVCVPQQSWRKGDVIEVAELMPDGWARVVQQVGSSDREDASPHKKVSMPTQTSYVLLDELMRLLTLPEDTAPSTTSVPVPDTEAEDEGEQELPSTPRWKIHPPAPLVTTPPSATDSPSPVKSPLPSVKAWKKARRASLLKQSESPDAASAEVATPVPPLETLGGAAPVPARSESLSLPRAMKAPQQEGAAAHFRKKPAAFFGICDLKYDVRQPVGKRVIVLELGSGKTSRFSGYGEHVRLAFEDNYRLVKAMDRAALVDNKKMTHDIFLECGLEHLRPLQKAFERQWKPNLPALVASELQAQDGDAVVLKLVNRCRGAGVVVARVGKELEQVLRQLLVPSQDVSVGGVPVNELSDLALKKALASNPCDMREQALHWWSNECPVFVAEKCMESQPVQKDGVSYDATMRIGFVLQRSEDSADVNFSVEYLGGYWKLPAASMTSQDVRARCVSKARSGTAPVDERDLHACYDELRDALPRVFAIDRAGAASIISRYTNDINDPLIFAFTLARQGAEQVKREGRVKTSSLSDNLQSVSGRFFGLARKRIESQLPPEWANYVKDYTATLDLSLVHGLQPAMEFGLVPPVLFALSYVERQLGVVEAYKEMWESAVRHFRRSLVMHPLNATSEYLIGVYHLKRAEYCEARSRFVRSLRLDPEFKAAYVNIGVVSLALREWNVAIAASEAGLRRHPQAFQCNYNLGLALGHQLRELLSSYKSGIDPDRVCELAFRSAFELRTGRDQKEQSKSDWNSFDDAMLALLESMPEELMAMTTPIYASPQKERCKHWCSDLQTALSRLSGWSQVNFRP